MSVAGIITEIGLGDTVREERSRIQGWVQGLTQTLDGVDGAWVNWVSIGDVTIKEHWFPLDRLELVEKG